MTEWKITQKMIILPVYSLLLQDVGFCSVGSKDSLKRKDGARSTLPQLRPARVRAAVVFERSTRICGNRCRGGYGSAPSGGGPGPRDDRVGASAVVSEVRECMITSSFSKTTRVRGVGTGSANAIAEVRITGCEDNTHSETTIAANLTHARRRKKPRGHDRTTAVIAESSNNQSC